MITKGIITKVNATGNNFYSADVSIPLLNTVQESFICTIPRCNFIPCVGDVVFVTFEDYDINKPIILGCLFKESGNESLVDLNVQCLTSNSTTILSNSTTIGDVTYDELKNLIGLKQNVQNSLVNIDNIISNQNFDTSKNLKVVNSNPYVQLQVGNSDYYLQAYNDSTTEGVAIGSTWAKSLIVDNLGNVHIKGSLDVRDNYSQNEVKIGQWIDGKSLYRKVIDYNGNLTTNSEIEIGNIGSALSSVVDIKQTATYTPSNGNNSAYDTYYNPTTGTHSIIGCRVDLTNGKVYACSVNDSWTNTHLIVIVEYTKA